MTVTVLSINRTPTDFVAKTRHLSVEDRGAYQEILDQIVILGQNAEPPSIPDDERMIANLLGWTVAKWRKTRDRLCFGENAVLVAANGRLSQTRIVEEIEAARIRIEKAAGAGIASGASRRSKLRDRLNSSRTPGELGTNSRLNVSSTPGELGSNSGRTRSEPVTSHELLVTNTNKSSPSTTTSVPEPVLRVVEAVGAYTTNLRGLTDECVATWIRDYGEAFLAAVIADVGPSLAGKDAAYLHKALRRRHLEGWQPPQIAIRKAPVDQDSVRETARELRRDLAHYRRTGTWERADASPAEVEQYLAAVVVGGALVDDAPTLEVWKRGAQ